MNELPITAEAVVGSGIVGGSTACRFSRGWSGWAIAIKRQYHPTNGLCH